jgi:hypothetical protein
LLLLLLPYQELAATQSEGPFGVHSIASHYNIFPSPSAYSRNPIPPKTVGDTAVAEKTEYGAEIPHAVRLATKPAKRGISPLSAIPMKGNVGFGLGSITSPSGAG